MSSTFVSPPPTYCAVNTCSGCTAFCASDGTCISCDAGFLLFSSGFAPFFNSIVSTNCDGAGLCINATFAGAQPLNVGYSQCWSVDSGGRCLLCADNTCAAVMAPTPSATATLSLGAMPSLSPSRTPPVSCSATMPPTPSPSGTFWGGYTWIFAPPAMTCVAACHAWVPGAGCAPSGGPPWPSSAADMAAVAAAANVSCGAIYEGACGLAQDPEWSPALSPYDHHPDGECYWGGGAACNGIDACTARPDGGSRRFCPCGSPVTHSRSMTRTPSRSMTPSLTPTATRTRTRTGTRTHSPSQSPPPSRSAKVGSSSHSRTETATRSRTRKPK